MGSEWEVSHLIENLNPQRRHVRLIHPCWHSNLIDITAIHDPVLHVVLGHIVTHTSPGCAHETNGINERRYTTRSGRFCNGESATYT